MVFQGLSSAPQIIDGLVPEVTFNSKTLRIKQGLINLDHYQPPSHHCDINRGLRPPAFYTFCHRMAIRPPHLWCLLCAMCSWKSQWCNCLLKKTMRLSLVNILTIPFIPICFSFFTFIWKCLSCTKLTCFCPEFVTRQKCFLIPQLRGSFSVSASFSSTLRDINLVCHKFWSQSLASLHVVLVSMS